MSSWLRLTVRGNTSSAQMGTLPERCATVCQTFKSVFFSRAAKFWRRVFLFMHLQLICKHPIKCKHPINDVYLGGCGVATFASYISRINT